ncbi:hypothetical protein WN943_002380 [Citrus x changshan-huyou]|nr:uncharacterized protein LOC102616281 isoform X12 [Citrus sinensis]XP_052289637.1 uncharacterized protein LOC102616281 isoform X12 [Citrus sinensis]XP_052289638.1 uncharacterized protein LOC102616281 isoform X12 [Citrus sinensis]
MLVGHKERNSQRNKSYIRRTPAGSWLILVVSLHQLSTVVYHILDTMPPSSSFVSEQELKMFHSIDRELYTLLTINLWRDPVESLQIMALWLWLERTSLNDVVSKILTLPDVLINEIADEAVTCLNCINNDHSACSSESYVIPLTQSVMDKEISLRFFHENRLKATEGVAKVANEVCIRALNDIMQRAVARNAAQSIADSQKMMTAQPFQQSLVHPGFSQMRFGSSDVLESVTPENEVPPDDRTMFVTFSKGYPVQEREVGEFFTRTYGDCIESLVMQDVQSSEQSLFAKIVFRSTATIDVILNGMGKVKFTINGKHVWARKYVPKRPKSQLMPSPPSV